MWLQARVRIAVLSVVALLAWLAAAQAQTWPSRSITLVAAFPPNTTTDYAARTIAQELTKSFDHPVVVESAGAAAFSPRNRSKAPPDGHAARDDDRFRPPPAARAGAGLRPVADFTPVTLVKMRRT
jgi:hypothetical protein